MKETLFLKLDRNLASPTESADGGKETIGNTPVSYTHLERLAALGFSFVDSMANFIFAAHKSVPAEELFLAMKQAGIYVRYFKKPRIDNYLRITIGTDEEMEELYKFLGHYLAH